MYWVHYIVIDVKFSTIQNKIINVLLKVLVKLITFQQVFYFIITCIKIQFTDYFKTANKYILNFDENFVSYKLLYSITMDKPFYKRKRFYF